MGFVWGTNHIVQPFDDGWRSTDEGLHPALNWSLNQDSHRLEILSDSSSPELKGNTQMLFIGVCS